MMKIDAEKMDIALAKKALPKGVLFECVSRETVRRIHKGCDVGPVVAGKIARRLDCDVEDLLADR